MPELHVTSGTTLRQLQDFAQSVPTGHQLRGKQHKDGSITIYSKNPDKKTFNTKTQERPAKFSKAREGIRQILERNTGGAKIDSILNGIHRTVQLGSTRGATPQPLPVLTGAKLQQDIGRTTVEIDRQQREQRQLQGTNLQGVSTHDLLGRDFSVSGSGATGVVFAPGTTQGETDVVLKFESRERVEITDILFKALNQVSDLPGGLPFSFGSHEKVEPGEELDAMRGKLQGAFKDVQDQIQGMVDKHGVQLTRPLFMQDGTVDTMAFDRIRNALRNNPEELSEFLKAEGKLGRLQNMMQDLQTGGAFSKYAKLDGRPVESLGNDQKRELLTGSHFPQSLGKGGMIVSLLGLTDHGGTGIANIGNFLVDDSGSLSIVDINTRKEQAGNNTFLGVPNKNMLDECRTISDLISGGKLDKQLKTLLGQIENGQQPPEFGGVARFAMATIGAPDGDRMFEPGQEGGHDQVVGNMSDEEKVRLCANYLLGAFEGMRHIVENKDQIKQLMIEHGIGYTNQGGNIVSDPDELLNGIETAFQDVTPKQLQKLRELVG